MDLHPDFRPLGHGALLRKYHVRGRIEAHLHEYGVDRLVPVIYLAQDSFGSAVDVVKKVEALMESDDVLCEDFLSETIVLPDKASGNSFSSNVKTRLQTSAGTWKIKNVLPLSESCNIRLPSGPYFIFGFTLHQAWLLYDDYLDTFITTIVPDDNQPGRYQVLQKTSEDGAWKSVAVPNRLYYHSNTEKPSAGKRFSAKDCFQVAGIRATQNNRCFTELYGPATETAMFVQRLEKLGAVLVGKSKMCSFASSEEATDQWIDFHAPFNSRADGYQSPSGSTTRGATAIAGYSWLDFAVGTDTTGSIRWPAAWNGIFGLRTTFNSITTFNSNDLTGVSYACRDFDTVGLLTGDLEGMSLIARSSIQNTPRIPSKYPKQIFYCTDFFPHSNKDQQAAVNEYVSMLENFLRVKRTDFSIAERWKQCPPSEADRKSIQEYLDTTAFYLFYWDGYHGFDNFRAEYKAKTGKDVYVGPYVRWKWAQGEKVTPEQYDRSKQELAVYRKWFAENVLNTDDQAGSTAVMILPCGSSVPKYRDDPNNAPGPVPAFSTNYIASMIGLPQLVMPIGQFPYDSRVSGHREHLPVVGTMVGAKGSELMLLDLTQEALASAHWATGVNTGRYALELGPPPRYTAPEGADPYL